MSIDGACLSLYMRVLTSCCGLYQGFNFRSFEQDTVAVPLLFGRFIHQPSLSNHPLEMAASRWEFVSQSLSGAEKRRESIGAVILVPA